MDDEWTDWIEHDGKGCPCEGYFAEVEWECYRSGNLYRAGQRGLTAALITPQLAAHPAWAWAGSIGGVFRHPVTGKSGRLDGAFVRYRIRKPRAMAQIRALLENLPERVDA